MKTQQSGFTLIELVMVIVILGILGAVAIPKFVNLKAEANDATASGIAAALSSASAINYTACQVTSAAAKCTPLVTGATTTCSDIGGLLLPVVTITAGALPSPTVQGSLYIVTDTPLTTTGVSCSLVFGDGTATGVVRTYTGLATS